MKARMELLLTRIGEEFLDAFPLKKEEINHFIELHTYVEDGSM